MDGPSPPQETLTLIVKTPNQAHGDRAVEGVQPSWTVGQLKSHLSGVYPGSPPEKDQRLIYSGKLLPDHLLLRDVFRKSDTTPTLHLVCAFKPPGSQHGSQPKAAGAEACVQSVPRAAGQAAGAAPPGPSGDGLRHRGSAGGVPSAWTSPAMLGGADVRRPAYSVYSPQQLLWLQQMYVRQYYMQYQAALAAASSHVAPSGPSLPVVTPAPVPLANQAPADNLPANQNAPQPPLINPGANRNLRMNAQGGPVMEDEEDVNRDWLDWVYTAARFSVFLSILYFYSSVSRFVLVMSSLLIMYLHTAGWFPFRRRAVHLDPNHAQPAEAVENQQNRNAGRPPEELLGEEQEGAPLPAVDAEPQRVTLMGTAWVFFKAFFSSLIPEGPQAIGN
uniref:Homocysteine-inducible, endoplasmic reticulum stress-inducible, ubiquitin-like domain member 1 n=1 Tax=Lepisosteus oculatus TaxID=7918 RepID=W5MM95_LEPOC|nr:PREDICTED: homocysteine-responsive endoplasmic reticulum-resident ubiquitin-like domain member 1 protein [Lepisosteus oculatus]